MDSSERSLDVDRVDRENEKGPGGKVMKTDSRIPIMMIAVFVIAIIVAACTDQKSIEGVREVKEWRGDISISLEPDEYGKEMERIINGIDQWYAHKERKEIDIDQLRNTYVSMGESAANLKELNWVLLKLFAELENGHSQVFTGVSQYGVPILADIMQGEWVVIWVGGQEQLDQKIEKGWRIKEIDHLPVQEWLEERITYISASTNQGLWQEGSGWIFRRHGDEPQTRQYLFLCPSGKRYDMPLSLTIPRDQMEFRQLPMVETEEWGEYGYIAVNTMMNGVVEAFDSALDKMQDKEGIILDLRNNGGGNSLNGDKIFRRLIQEETAIWQGRSAKPYDDVNYSGKIVVLTGPRTHSAAESFAFDLHDSGRVLTMGEATKGDSGGGPRFFRTDGGIVFRIPTRGVDKSASGLPMEGAGLEPHITIEQTYEDFLADVDTAVQAGIAWMKSNATIEMNK